MKRDIVVIFILFICISCGQKHDITNNPTIRIISQYEKSWINYLEKSIEEDTINYDELKSIYFLYNSSTSVTYRLISENYTVSKRDEYIDNLGILLDRKNKFFVSFCNCSIESLSKTDLKELLNIEKEIFILLQDMETSYL